MYKRQLGYRVDAVNRTLVDEKGVVDDARLAEILQEMGVLDNVDTETYEQTDALSAKMQDILANAATTYSPREAKIQQERDASIRNQAEAQRFIDELLQNNQLGIKTIEELDELLAKVVSKPDDVDVVKVNRNAIKYLQAKTAEMNKDYQEAIRQIRQEAVSYTQRYVYKRQALLNTALIVTTSEIRRRIITNKRKTTNGRHIRGQNSLKAIMIRRWRSITLRGCSKGI